MHTIPRAVRTFILVLALGSLWAARLRSQLLDSSQVARLLKPADVEQVTGLKGVRLVPQYSTAWALSDLNFAVGNDTVDLVSVQVHSKVPWWENMLGAYTERSPVSGVGEAAFIPIQLRVAQGQLNYLKGIRGVSLISGMSGGKPRLSNAQLIALGKLIASRL